VYPVPPHWFHASAGLAVGVAGLADDAALLGTGVLDAFAEVGLADDLGGAADEVGLFTTDDDLLPPGLLEPARARILAAACSAMVTMYEVGLVVMWLCLVSGRENLKSI
jgi:hypothetical protein